AAMRAVSNHGSKVRTRGHPSRRPRHSASKTRVTALMARAPQDEGGGIERFTASQDEGGASTSPSRRSPDEPSALSFSLGNEACAGIEDGGGHAERGERRFCFGNERAQTRPRAVGPEQTHDRRLAGLRILAGLLTDQR